MAEDLRVLDETEPYSDFAKRMVDTCLVNDPWYDGLPIYRSAPMILSAAYKDRIYKEASRVGVLYDELARIIHAEPALLDDFFHLPPHYKLMWLSSDGLWHGFARMDMFHTVDDKLVICELNADTPSGQVEAIVPNELVRDRYPEYEDPNRGYEAALFDVFERFHEATFGTRDIQRAGILYPTDLSEDITLIRIYEKWLEARGIETTLGSPHNLALREDRGVTFLGKPVDLIVRHYKTDWWGERPRIFAHEQEVPNPEPLRRELFTILEAERNKKLAVVNPFGALVPQNKLALAFFWEEMERFSESGKQAIKDLIPETRRLDVMDREALKAERADWVLKSDFGCEGDEVLVGPNEDDATWAFALDNALPFMWVAQRFFDVRPITLAGDDAPGDYLPNLGVYLVGGQPHGLLVRLAPAGVTTGENARVVPVLVEPADRSR